MLLCISGSCTLTLADGRSTLDFVLDRPNRGLRLGPLQWEKYRLSADAVLLVVTSTLYDRADYIEDYDEFLALVGHDD